MDWEEGERDCMAGDTNVLLLCTLVQRIFGIFISSEATANLGLSGYFGASALAY